MEEAPPARGNGVSRQLRDGVRRAPARVAPSDPMDRGAFSRSANLHAIAEADEGDGHSRPETSFSTESGPELNLEPTLLSVMAVRMGESADGLDRGASCEPLRVQRALEAHRRFVIEVHHEDERRLASARAGVWDLSVRHALVEGAEEHPSEPEFQRDASRLPREGTVHDRTTARRLSRPFGEEAGRIKAPHAHEEEAIYRHLGQILPAAMLARLLRVVRALDN